MNPRTPYSAELTFSDGTTMSLVDVTANPRSLASHYNKFVRAFMRHLGAIHVTSVKVTSGPDQGEVK